VNSEDPDKPCGNKTWQSRGSCCLHELDFGMRNLSWRAYSLTASAASVAAYISIIGNGIAAGPLLTSSTISEIVAGSTVHIDTPLGIALPMTFEPDGTVRGSAGKILSFYMEAESDHGRWWVADNKLCQKWRKWFESKQTCLTLKRDGSKYAWARDDGKTGTATIITKPAPSIIAKIEQAESMPRASSLGGPSPSAPMPAPAPVASLVVKPAPVVARPQPVAKVMTLTQPSQHTATKSLPATVTTEIRDPTTPRGITYRVVNVPANDTLNVRAAPNTTSSIVSAVSPQGRGLVMLGDCAGAWCPMSHAGKSGWVHRSFLTLEPMTVSAAR
jgi:hypothetical protein